MADKLNTPSWKKFKSLPFSGRNKGVSVNKLGRDAVRHTRRFVSSRLDRLATIKRMLIGWLFLSALLISISLAQWYGFRPAYTTEAPAAGGTFSEGVLGPLETLNPLYARSSAEKSAAKLMFSSLYNYDQTGNLRGDMAKSVEISDTSTEYIVHMRPNIKWSDGYDLTAEDVVFTVGLLKHPDTRSEFSGWELFSAEVISPTKVKFTLPGAYAPFLHSLTFPVLPKHILAKIEPSELREQSFSFSPVTSGPFTFRLLQDSSSGQSKKTLRLASNQLYIHGQPLLERFQLNVYESKDDIKKALMSDEIVATPELIHGEVSNSLKDSYISQSHSINDGVYALFNNKDGLMSNRNLREALAISISREKLRSSIGQSSKPLEGPILSSQIEGDLPSFATIDIDKARKLLDNEGWIVSGDLRKKGDQALTVNMVALNGVGFSNLTNQLADAWRKELQIRVNVSIIDPLDTAQNVLQSVLQPRNFDVLVYELVLGGDPDVYAYWHSNQAKTTGLNFANYSSVIADDALSGARSKTDLRYRSDRYRAFVRRWQADVPAIPLYQPKIDYIMSNSVSSMTEDMTLVTQENRYANVIYWSVARASVYRTP